MDNPVERTLGRDRSEADPATALPGASRTRAPRPSHNNVRKFREQLGLSLGALARKSQVETSTILRIESGETTNPNPLTKQAIAAAFGQGITVKMVWPDA